MSHALVIGGTGMLSNAVIELLNSYDTVSVLARKKAGFEILKKEAGSSSKRLNFLETDYNNYIELTKSLISASLEHGEITLAVLWIHSAVKLARVITAKVINETSLGCDLYEVSGSLDPDEENKVKSRGDEFSEFSNINYHSITLGFVLEPAGQRWLSDKEISDGVLFAIRNGLKSHQVGVTKPIEKRP